MSHGETSILGREESGVKLRGRDGGPVSDHELMGLAAVFLKALDFSVYSAVGRRRYKGPPRGDKIRARVSIGAEQILKGTIAAAPLS